MDDVYVVVVAAVVDLDGPQFGLVSFTLLPISSPRQLLVAVDGDDGDPVGVGVRKRWVTAPSTFDLLVERHRPGVQLAPVPRRRLLSAVHSMRFVFFMFFEPLN